MTKTFLRLREYGTLPVEAEMISPDHLAGLSRVQVQALPILVGRRRRTLGDLFEVEGDGSAEIEIEGDLSHVKRIGQGMTQGRIEIQGPVGMHVGSGMSGGEIVVHGPVGAWAGAKMAGGTLWVHGDAGSMLGAPYVGETRGMKGGLIVVEGNAGPRAGERMRRGSMVIQGCTADLTGARMVAGSIVVLGKLGPRPGAGMKRGTIVALGGLEEGLLPTFGYACTYQPTFLRAYLRYLQSQGVPIRPEQIDGEYRRYAGDVNTIGKGEILVYG